LDGGLEEFCELRDNRCSTRASLPAPDDHSSPEPADITDTLNHNSHKNNTSHRPLPPEPRPLRSEHGLNA